MIKIIVTPAAVTGKWFWAILVRRKIFMRSTNDFNRKSAAIAHAKKSISLIQGLDKMPIEFIP